MKFNNGPCCSLGINIGRALPTSLQDYSALLELELMEETEGGFLVQVLSVTANGHTYTRTVQGVLTAREDTGTSTKSALSTGTAAELVPAESVSEGCLVHRCIRFLAKQPLKCMPLTQLCEKLSIQDVSAAALTKLCLDYSCFFATSQDSSGVGHIQLLPMDGHAAGQLLMLGSNVTVLKNKRKKQETACEGQQLLVAEERQLLTQGLGEKQQETAEADRQLPKTGLEEHSVSVWVSLSTIFMDSLEGLFYSGEPLSSIVLHLTNSRLSVKFLATPEMKQQLPDGTAVNVCLKTVTFGQPMTHSVFPLSLTAQIDNQSVRFVTAEGQKLKFSEKIAVRISPEVVQSQMGSGLLSVPNLQLPEKKLSVIDEKSSLVSTGSNIELATYGTSVL
jgi:hypothetical protein